MPADASGSPAARRAPDPMPLAGRALLALWNDIRREREAEYDRWHTVEHVPERVAVTGMRGARRYVNRARSTHRYFTLYELDDLDVLDGAEYRDLVDHPTPWSASMRPDFANVVRVPCRVTHGAGDGIGAAIAIVCFEAGADLASPADLLAADGVVAVHLARGVPSSGPGAWPRSASGHVPRAFDAVLLAEALDRAAAARILPALRQRAGLDDAVDDFGADVYDLAYAFPGHREAARERHRRPHWARGA